ncbi:MAG TPA: B12-binding domain-containing radical SAM protein [Geopsychrobacteraceae bacterium]|nr:B12-binding domain-containing radical SAM protein [Geopsychrobacteraceae bacterium]
MNILLPTLHVRPSAQATPLAAACLKAALPAAFNKNTRLLDLYLSQSQEQMLDEILRLQPDVIAFPLYLWNRTEVLSMTKQLRQKQRTLYLLAGGPEASADSEAVLREGALDAVICGEGENAFASLIRALAEKAPIQTLAGICTPDAPAKAAVYCENLDRLPSPYLQKTLVPEAGGGLLWEVARGCPFNCAFCYDAKGQQGVRPLPRQRLEKELELFVASGTEQVWILDSTFNFPAERGQELIRLLLEKAPGIHYHLEAKADFLDHETVQLLAQLQCSVQIGLQSADPQVLKPLHRSFDPDQLLQKLQMLSQAGIIFGLDLIYGLPGDTHQGFRQSLDSALLTEPNQLDIFPLAVLPGTQLFLDQKKLDLQTKQSPPYEIISSPGYPTEELAQSRLLAAATDIFYNRGRAVGFMLPICQALEIKPSTLLDSFSLWLQEERSMTRERILTAEEWQPAHIFPLQQDFLHDELGRYGKPHLQQLVNDLICYHYYYAEALLGHELPPGHATDITANAWQEYWQQAEALRLIDFNYELDELMAKGGMELQALARELKPTGSTAIFLRQGQHVLCESLQDDFALLLKESNGKRSPAEILPHLEPEEGMELLEFAITEGLLQR